MSSSRKKVIVRRFVAGPLRGYLESTDFVHRSPGAAPRLQMLDLAGRMQELPLEEIKHVSYVREFHLNDEVNPERLPRKLFLARPRGEGLWVRVSFRDDDTVEGLAPLDIALADSLGDDLGLQLTPPDVRGNTQRVYIPRTAMSAMQIVAVVTSPARRKAFESSATPAVRADEQPNLFPAEAISPSVPQ